jgi:hydrogenase maturation protease
MEGAPSTACILCVGNRLVADDALGGAVCDELQQRQLPAEVTVVDGGLGGIDLLGHLDAVPRVVVVDAIRDSASPGEVRCLSAGDLEPETARFGHGNGAAYLVAVAPVVLGDDAPELWLVGTDQWTSRTVRAVADAAVAVALGGPSSLTEGARR